MNYTKKQRDHYNEDRRITCYHLGITENQYNWFRRMGQTLHKIYEDNCNGLIDDEVEYQNIVNPLYAKVEDKANKLALYVFFQTDPRGATIYLSKEQITDINYNRPGSECIY